MYVSLSVLVAGLAKTHLKEWSILKSGNSYNANVPFEKPTTSKLDSVWNAAQVTKALFWRK